MTKIMPKHLKTRKKKYLERIRNDPEKYEAYKAAERERAKIYRLKKKQSLDDEELKIFREKNRIRARKSRLNKKLLNSRKIIMKEEPMEQGETPLEFEIKVDVSEESLDFNNWAQNQQSEIPLKHFEWENPSKTETSPPKSVLRCQRAYRERIRSDPEKYEAYKAVERERAKIYRSKKKQSLDEKELKILREKNRIRAQKSRSRKRRKQEEKIWRNQKFKKIRNNLGKSKMMKSREKQESIEENVIKTVTIKQQMEEEAGREDLEKPENVIFIMKKIKQEPELDIVDEIPESGKIFEAPKNPFRSFLEKFSEESVEKFRCHVCFKVFKRGRFSLKRHILETHSEKKYECDFCGRRFGNRRHIECHIFSIHVRGKNSISCSLCNKFFLRKSSYVAHMNSHLDVRNFKCMDNTNSGQKYATKRRIYEHLGIHVAGGKYKCPWNPERTFGLRGSFTQHIKQYHVQQRIFKCDNCAASFYRQFELNRHMVVHSKIKPFSCSLCSCKRSFTRQWSLQNHIKYVHEKQKTPLKQQFQCDRCAKFTSTKFQLLEHLFIHFGLKPFQCSVCLSYRSFNRSSLYTHLRRVHKIAKPSVSLKHVI